MKFLPAAWQTPGRVSVDFIAVHWMATTLAGCDATFTDGKRQASAHYGVENRTVHQYVHDHDTAWSLGNWEANQRSISVEHSAQPGRDATDETYQTSIELIAGLCVKHGLVPSHDTIRPHNHFQATQCPGTLDLERIITGVQKLLTPAPVTEQDTSKMLILAKRPDETAVWIGDGITRRQIPNAETLNDLQWLAANGLNNVFKNGEVQTWGNMEVLGQAV